MQYGDNYEMEMTPDNNYLVKVYDGEYQEVASLSVPVTNSGGDALYTMYTFGYFSYDDLCRGTYSDDERFNFIITRYDYIVSNDSFVYNFDVYDEDGERIAVIGEGVTLWKQLSDIDGQPVQVALMRGSNGNDEAIQMVNLPSCEVVTTFPGVLDGNLLSTSFDRYPVRNTYQYVFGLGDGIYGEDGGIVHDVGKIGTGEADGTACDVFEADIIGELLVAGMDLQDGGSSVLVGKVNRDGPVETAGSRQGRVEDIGSVGGGHDDDAGIVFESVHFDEELVQGLLSFVVSAAKTRSSLTSDGIDFIDEDETRGVGLRCLEEGTDTRGADTDIHFDEVGSGDGIERDAGLACDSLGKKGLTGARRADKEHAMRQFRPQSCVFVRRMEVIDKLDEFGFRLVASGDIGETDLRGSLLSGDIVDKTCHRTAGTATEGFAHAVVEEEYDADEDEGQNQRKKPGTDGGRGFDAVLIMPTVIVSDRFLHIIRNIFHVLNDRLEIGFKVAVCQRHGKGRRDGTAVRIGLIELALDIDGVGVDVAADGIHDDGVVVGADEDFQESQIVGVLLLEGHDDALGIADGVIDGERLVLGVVEPAEIGRTVGVDFCLAVVIGVDAILDVAGCEGIGETASSKDEEVQHEADHQCQDDGQKDDRNVALSVVSGTPCLVLGLSVIVRTVVVGEVHFV